jgi:hypothetical protein
MERNPVVETRPFQNTHFEGVKPTSACEGTACQLSASHNEGEIMRSLSALGLCSFLLFAAVAVAEDAPAAKANESTIDELLSRGDLSSAEQRLRRQLVDKPEADEARLQLGFVCVLRSLERFAQFHWEYGVRMEYSFLALGPQVDENPHPNAISHAAWRRGFETWHRDLSEAEAILAGVKDKSVKVHWNMADVQWDLEADGKPERFLAPSRSGLDPLANLRKDNPNFQIGFDYADALWLRGYCHLMLAALDLVLAIDTERSFYYWAPEVYAKPAMPPEIAKLSREEREQKFAPEFYFHLRLKERDRWRLVRGHLLKTIELSRQMWEAIEKETDDDREWLPNPRQQSVLKLKINEDMIAAWRAALDEGEAVLEGKKLVAWDFWPQRRDDESRRGLNLRRLLDDPPAELKPLNWFSRGPSDYMEEGELMDREVFQRLNQAFGPDLMMFSIWIN